MSERPEPEQPPLADRLRHHVVTSAKTQLQTIRSLPGRLATTVRRRLPRRWYEWVTSVLLLVVFGVYLRRWIGGNWNLLANPMLHADDVRTTLIAFHRYEADPTLLEDPIASEMLALCPPLPWFLYRITVPLTGLYWAPKVVQLVALAVVLAAVVVAATSRRTGLAGGVLVAFATLQSTFAVYRLAGGLPRAFGFPCFALWLAGALAGNRAARRVAAIIAALSYPSAMLLILGAEGVLTLHDATRPRVGVVLRRLRRYAVTVALCFACVVPSVFSFGGGPSRGPVHTLAQAEKEPAFSRTGRLWILPFRDPVPEFQKASFAVVRPRGKALWKAAGDFVKKHDGTIPLLLVGMFFAAAALRLVPAPRAALAMGVSCVTLYALARFLAFRLYSTERFYSFGGRMAMLALAVCATAPLCFWIRRRWRASLRHVAAAAIILATWGILGDGIKPNNGLTTNGERHARLMARIRQLPKTARIACHPMDCDDIPFWGARANVGGFETLQPWFVDSWRRQKRRAQDTLGAMYATDVATLEAYVKKYRVTHFLVNPRRYRRDFVRYSGTFDPLNGYARKLLRGKRPRQMLLARPPRRAQVIKAHGLILVDAEQLILARRR